MFDATALKAIIEELNEKILHGRVQEIVQLDALTFELEIYAHHARHYLYISAHPEDARVHLVSNKIRGSGETPSPLLLLLRKLAENAFIASITQLPHERVLKIQFDHSAEGLATLVIETIGRYSNLILLDADGVVVDSLKRVSSQVNRARVILPKRAYVPPPPQSKLVPSSLQTSDLAKVLTEHRGAPLGPVLVQTIAGVSPLLAREIAFRVQGKTDAPCDPTRSAELVKTLDRLSHSPWQPTVAFEEGEPAAFAPYALTHLAETRPFDSMSAAIEAFYGAPESYAAAKEPLRAHIAEARDRLARKRDALSQSLPSEEEVERLRISGEMILAYAAQIRPGQTSVAAETERGVVDIPLDPKITAVENAQKYFKDYHRAKDALQRIPALLQAANVEVDYAEQILNDLELAENRSEIDAVVRAAQEAGLLAETRSRVRVSESGPRAFTSQDGLTILVGKNARQNEEVTFRRAQPEDLWLHARNVPGAHVVVLRAGNEIPESTVQQAAQLAAYYSQARGETNVDVVVAPRRKVRHLRGGKAGMVTVRGERTVRVSALTPP